MATFPALSFSCPMSWETMQGDDKSRFCSKCHRSVVNLSALTEAQRVALLAQAKPGESCVMYMRRLSGEYVTAEEATSQRQETSSLRRYGVMTLAAGALAISAGCAKAEEPPPVLLLGAPIVAMPAEAKESPPRIGIEATPFASAVVREGLFIFTLKGSWSIERKGSEYELVRPGKEVTVASGEEVILSERHTRVVIRNTQQGGVILETTFDGRSFGAEITTKTELLEIK